MQDIFLVKEKIELPTPILLFDCTLADGQVERWASHEISVAGVAYEPRVVQQSRFEMRAAGDSAESRSTLTLSLDNVDSHFSEIESITGWKGAKLVASFLFFDLANGTAVSDPVAVYMGIADPPVEIAESSMTLTFRSRLEFSRSLLPQVRVQARCPWLFPRDAREREQALSGGGQEKYSPFYRCGYSPDIEGGVGNHSGEEEPYSTCEGTRRSCIERGMFDKDLRGQETRRFGGVEFVPASILVRSFGDKSQHVSEASESPTKYNDFVPLVYGTAWHKPSIVFSRNDGNLLHLEALIGIGPIDAIRKVVVNDVELPAGVSGIDMTATGWYNLCSYGNRNGGFNLDFASADGTPAGDPYGGMAFLSIVIPNRAVSGSSLPKVQVLLDGLRLPTYGEDGTPIAELFTRNPAWIVLDVLRRGGWTLDEIDLGSFARAAAVCDELIQVPDLNDLHVSVPRFEANVVLTRRRTVAEVLRGIRVSSGLLLRLGKDGRLELVAEGMIKDQQGSLPAGSNSSEPLAEGWPVYEFGDGTNGTSGILRRTDRKPALRLWSNPTAETPNRYSVEFQDSFNGYQQDSVSLVDADDAIRVGYEISSPLPALGIPSCEQALRVVKFHLSRSIYGNRFLELETSVRGIAIRPGDVIAVTYPKEGFDRATFRVLSIQPSFDYQTVTIQAQKHEDAWYEDLKSPSGGRSSDPRRGGMHNGIPRPLVPTELLADGRLGFAIVEEEIIGTDGGGQVVLHLTFAPPKLPSAEAWRRPLVSMIPRVEDEGQLEPSRIYYYAVSGIAENGDESGLSFVVAAETPSLPGGYSVTLTGLWFPKGYRGFRVYRGNRPSTMALILESDVLETEVKDSGSEPSGEVPPDDNYDHANFYSRMEVLPPMSVGTCGPASLSCEELKIADDALKGYILRITEGPGAGQEMQIVSNRDTTITLSQAWLTPPDSTSRFIVAEAGWQFAGTTTTSDIRFAVPNRRGSIIHIAGRSANFLDVECDPSQCFIERWTIGGSGGGESDGDIPPKPHFSLTSIQPQVVEVSGIGFDSLENTQTIQAGTLCLYYWDEVAANPTGRLDLELPPAGQIVELESDASLVVGDMLQVERELVQVLSIIDDRHFEIDRGKLGSPIAQHGAGTAVELLSRSIALTAFPKEFFGSSASGAFIWQVPAGTWRIAAAELYVTNSIGNSPTSANSFTTTPDRGLRVLSGGQYTLQVPGQLAVRSNCVPPIIIGEPRVIREILAATLVAPQGAPAIVRVTVDGTPLADLTIPDGQSVSEPLSGAGLPVLAANSRLNLDILSVGSGNGIESGRDLTITVRL